MIRLSILAAAISFWLANDGKYKKRNLDQIQKLGGGIYALVKVGYGSILMWPGSELKLNDACSSSDFEFREGHSFPVLREEGRK